MKVLLISAKPEKLNGGIAVWTDRYVSACPKFGIACTLVNTEVVGKRAEQGTAGRNMRDEFARTKRIFGDLKKVLDSDSKMDIAHLNTSCGTFGLFRDYWIARKIHKKGIPVVTHYHCDIPFWIHNPISKRYLGKIAKLSAGNFVLCENSHRYLLDQTGVESVKMPNFIAEEMISQSAKQIYPDLTRIFFVGRVEEAKGAAEYITVSNVDNAITRITSYINHSKISID